MKWVNLEPDHPLWINLSQIRTIDYQKGDLVLYLWLEKSEALIIKDSEVIAEILKAIGAN